MVDPNDITVLLDQVRAGHADAGALLKRVYAELHAIAQNRMRGERADHTLQATALVNEAYVRMMGGGAVPWENRRHFFVAAAESMRRILVEHARARARVKRGGDRRREHLQLEAFDVTATEHPHTMLALDEAYEKLRDQSTDIADVVQLRVFGGLDVETTAEALDVSTATVKRRWRFARAWLARELGETEGTDEGDETMPANGAE